MLVVIQFPISDARPFTNRSCRLDLPDFSALRTAFKPQFLRYFGPATDRFLGADAAWTDELSYCLARRGLRLTELGRQRLGTASSQLIPACAFRRLFSDGSAVARVEVGVCHTERAKPLFSLGASECLAIALSFLNLPTKIGGSPEVNGHPLILQGRNLARLFCRATTKQSKDPSHTIDERLVEDGRPLVLMEYQRDEIKHLPDQAHTIDHAKVRGANLAFTWMKTDWGPIGIWFLELGAATRNDLRSLRLCLLRLHAEREALDLVLKQLRRERITYDPTDDSSSRLEDYLNNVTWGIGRRNRFGISQSAIAEAFDAAESVQRPDTLAQLKLRYNGARTQICRKVNAYEQSRGTSRIVNQISIHGGVIMKNTGQIITGGTFSGPIINQLVADKIDNSFQTFNQSPSSADLKEAMILLHQEVKVLLSKMSEHRVGDQEEVANRLEIFTKQAAEKKPFSDVLQVTGKGLIEAAKTVAEMVGPITTAVHGILRLLGITPI